jgi:probable blue pigment (indigoidine) exporter
MSSPSSFHPVPMLIAAAACWGLGTVFTKQVLVDVPPLTLLAVQLSASCVFLLVVARLSRTPTIRWSRQLWRLTALGVLNPGLAYALALVGLTSISASMSVLLWALEPVVIVLLAIVFLRERVSAVVATAMATAVAGVLLVVHQPGAAGTIIGVFLTLTAVTACALYAVLARWLILDDSSVSVVLLQQLAALAFALLVAAVAEAASANAWSISSLTAAGWFAAAGSGILYYGLAFWLFLTGLRRMPASVAGSFITLVPVFGMAAGYVIGEHLSAVQWVGALVAMVAIGVIVIRQAESGQPT